MLLCVRPSLLVCVTRAFVKLFALRSGSRQTRRFASPVTYREMNSESVSVCESLPANGSRQSTFEAAKSHVSTDAAAKLSDEGSGHVEIQEGKAKILFPSSNEVFYNPVQEFNRDLR